MVRVSVRVAALAGVSVVSVVAAGVIASAQPEYPFVEPGWNMVEPEPLAALNARAEAAPATSALKPGDATSYDFTFYPGLPDNDTGHWTGQSWTVISLCEDPDVPFDREPQPDDLTIEGGMISDVDIKPGDGEGCWEFRLGQQWSPETGMTYTNRDHHMFRGFGFPFVSLAYRSPERIDLHIPATVNLDSQGLAADATIEVGRVVDRTLETLGDNITVTAGADENGLCTYEGWQEARLEQPGESGAWVYHVMLSSTDVEPPQSWVEKGKTWQDLGRASEAFVTVAREDGSIERREALPDALEPYLDNLTGGHSPTSRVMVDNVLPLTSDYSTDFWLGTNDIMRFDVTYTSPCAPDVEVGGSLELVEPGLPTSYKINMSVARPPEHATATTTLTIPVR